MSPLISPFGTLPDGEPVPLYTLGNARGFAVQVIPYGATIVSVLAPDRRNRHANVVLGLPDLDHYLGAHPYLGAVAGRVAGRISGARFVLDGEIFALAANDGPHHVHGGTIGFDRKLWTVESATRQSLRLTYLSGDGEEHYPGAVSVAVTYSISDGNAIVMDVEAVSNRPTPFSITQHSYFNLAGEGDILDHDLQILAETYAPMGPDLGLLGRSAPVTTNDFRTPRILREAIPRLFREHGDLYFLRGENPALARPAAILREPRSGRVLTVYTDEPCLQLYTGAFFDGTLTGENGRGYTRHAGLCLECEGYPDALNSPALGDITLRPGRTFRRRTIYAFSTQ